MSLGKILTEKILLRSASFVFLFAFSLQFGHTQVSESSLLTIITFVKFPYYYSVIIILFYKMFREVCAPWLVRTSSLYFLKARASSLTSALLRYNARSLRHRYGHINFKKELEKLVPRALFSYISPWKFLRTLENCEKHSPSARASPHFSRILKNSRVLI